MNIPKWEFNLGSLTAWCIAAIWLPFGLWMLFSDLKHHDPIDWIFLVFIVGAILMIFFGVMAGYCEEETNGN
jgi:hypothetical protein